MSEKYFNNKTKVFEKQKDHPFRRSPICTTFNSCDVIKWGRWEEKWEKNLQKRDGEYDVTEIKNG